MTKEGKVDKITEKTDEFAGSGVEATKGAADSKEKDKPEIVTVADVIKTLRAKGHKI